MPDEAIAGGILRILGSAARVVAELFLDLILERVGRIAIYVLTLGRIDTDQSATEGVNWLSAVVGFFTVGGLGCLGWRIFS